MGFPRKITELPLRTIIKNTDLIVSVDVDTNLTNKVTLESLATFIGDENQYVTGGTYNEITESINFVGNGGFPPFSVDVSQLTEDIYVTGATLNVAILEIGRNNGEPLISIDLSSLSGDTNTFVSGATLVGTTYSLEKNDGTTISTDFEPIISGKVDTTLFNVYTANTQTEINSKLDKSNFNTYSANTQTEINSKLDKSNFDTYSANTQTEIDSKISNGINNGGGNEIFSGKSGNVLYFKTLSGGSNTTLTNVGDVVKIDVTIPADTNTFITGTSLNNTTYTINQNDGSTFPTDFEPIISGKVDTTLFNVYTANTETEISSKLDKSNFDTYSANTQTEINSKLEITTFDNYTANTIDNNTFVVSGKADAATQQLTFTNTSGGTFNVSNAVALFSDNDINVTGGTYDNNTGCVTFTTNSGTTFPICGFITGLTDTFTSTGVYDNNTGEITFTRTDASIYTVDLSTLDLNDKFVSGGTYNSGTTSFDFVGNNGFTPFSVGVQPLISPFEFGTGTDAVQPRDSSYNNSTQNTVWLGGTVNKIMGDYNFIGNGLNHSIEASADYSFIGNGNNNQLGDGVNFLSYSAILAGKDNTIEGTVSNSAIIAGENNTITHSNTFILGSNISSTQTGTTYVENLNIGRLGSGISVNNLGIDASGNVVVGSSGTSSTDIYVTGATLNGNTLELERNNSLTAVTVDLSSLSATTPTIDEVISEGNQLSNTNSSLQLPQSGSIDWSVSSGNQNFIVETGGSNGYIRIVNEDGELEFGDGNRVSLASFSGSDLELKTGGNTDDFRIYLGTNGPSAGDVLEVKSLDGNTGLMGWGTPSEMDNIFVNSGNANAITQQLTFTNTSGGTFNVTNAAALFSDNDINVTGGTYNPNNGCVTFTTNSGSSFNVCGFLTGLTDTFISGSTLVGTEYTLERTDGVNITTDFSSIVSGKVDISLFNSYSADTQTKINDKLNTSTFNTYTANTTDNVVTGGTLVGTSLELKRNNGLLDVSIDLSALSGISENTFISGSTLVGTDYTLERNDGVNITTDFKPLVNTKLNITTFDSYTANTTDNVVTGATLVGTTLSLERNNGLLDVSVDLGSLTGGTSGGSSPYTTKAGGDVINWDYSTDGPNIKITLSGDASNVLTVDSVSEFPNGTSGFIIIDPSSSTDYKLPDENYGSDTGIKSYLSAADAALGGTNPVRLHYTYDGTSFWFDKFTNMIEPIYPPSVDFDTNDLIAFYHPESFNQSVSGGVSGGFAVPNISSSILIGDLAIGADATNFDFTVRDDSINQPAFWTMGDDENEIITPSTLGATIDTNNTVSFYMKGDYQTGYCGLIDFYDGSGIYEETLYLYNKFFRSYDPSFTFSYAELLDYSGDGGADLTSEWLFVSYSIDENNNELTLYVGCQSSLDAARAASGATNWDYSGLGDTVSVDANGLYSETASVTIDETTFDRFYYGNSAGSGEGALCSLGMLGIYSSVIPSSQVLSNWESTRSTYYIT